MGRFDDLVARAHQGEAEDLAEVRIVIDDEQTCHGATR
jgi:hypothetical protein